MNTYEKMSDQHRGGAWGTSAENAVWWPGAISADQSNLHHQQILNQHHQAQQQNHMQNQQVLHQVVQTQALNDAARSNTTTSVAASQQLFSYKMASSFPTPTSSASAYDYRLNMGAPQSMATTNPGTQWWYTTAGQNAIENLQQQQQQHQQQQQQQQQQVQQSQPQQHQTHQTQNIHNVHSNTTPVSSIFLSLTNSPLFSRLFYITYNTARSMYFLLSPPFSIAHIYIYFCHRPSE